MTVATTTKPPTTRRRARRAGPAPSLGPVIRRWWRRARLIHAEGDYYGQPFEPRPWQVPLIDEMYELTPDGRRQYDRVLVGYAKGQGKTELAALVSVTEFCGPVEFAGWNADGTARGRARTSPDIPVAAASFDQADHVFSACRSMVRGSLLADLCEVYDTEILLKGRPGRLYRVAAVAGTNDGGKPTFWVADELHEWTGTKERVHLVLSNNRAKRRDAWELAITTAGWDPTALLGRLYQHGKRVRAGEESDPSFLFRWTEAADHWDLSDPAQLEAAIREANPAVGDFLPFASVRGRFSQMPEYEFRRYHLNQFTSAPDRWLPVGAWEACTEPAPVPDGSTLALGFDGSFSRDATAIVGCTPDRRLVVLHLWEKPEGAGDDWRVQVPEVMDALRAACRRFHVTAIGCDPYLWREVLGQLLEEGLPIVEWPSHQAAHMVPACAAFYDAVVNRQLRHDGDARLARHVAHCVVKIDSRGPRIVKDHKDSPRRIDLAVASVIAHDMIARHLNTSGWDFAAFDLESPR